MDRIDEVSALAKMRYQQRRYRRRLLKRMPHVAKFEPKEVVVPQEESLARQILETYFVCEGDDDRDNAYADIIGYGNYKLINGAQKRVSRSPVKRPALLGDGVRHLLKTKDAPVDMSKVRKGPEQLSLF